MHFYRVQTAVDRTSLISDPEVMGGEYDLSDLLLRTAEAVC